MEPFQRRRAMEILEVRLVGKIRVIGSTPCKPDMTTSLYEALWDYAAGQAQKGRR